MFKKFVSCVVSLLLLLNVSTSVFASENINLPSNRDELATIEFTVNEDGVITPVENNKNTTSMVYTDGTSSRIGVGNVGSAKLSWAGDTLINWQLILTDIIKSDIVWLGIF